MEEINNLESESHKPEVNKPKKIWVIPLLILIILIMGFIIAMVFVEINTSRNEENKTDVNESGIVDTLAPPVVPDNTTIDSPTNRNNDTLIQNESNSSANESGSSSSGGGGRNPTTCMNDDGCTSVGNFCSGNTPYSCSLGGDGCLDRVNEDACGEEYHCNNGLCIENASFYVDGLLTQNCTVYNPLTRACGGGDEEAYNNLSWIDSQLQAGDLVYIREGTYKEQLTLTQSGTAADPITIQGYPGEEVIISGAENLTGWIQCENASDCRGNPNYTNIYYNAPEFVVSQLLQNGTRLSPSRYPKKDAGVNNYGWNFATSISGTSPRSKFNDTALTVLDNDYLNGSYCHNKRNEWSESKTLVQDFDNSTGEVTLADNITTDLSTTYGYYFTNIVPEISEEDEWAYYGSKTYFYPSGGDLDNIQASKRVYGVYLNSADNYIIKNLKIEYVNSTGIYVYYSENVSIDSNTVRYPYFTGIWLRGSDNCSVINNTIEYSGNRGIWASVGSDNNTLDYNTISDTAASEFKDDVNGGQELPDYNVDKGTAIYLEGSTRSVNYNKINKTGYCGIKLAPNGSESSISYNYITNSGLSFADGGGIYVGYGWRDPAVLKYDYITDNIVSDTYGYTGGRAGYNASIPNHFMGIYTDAETNDVTVINNTVFNTPYIAILISRSQYIPIQDNTVYNYGYIETPSIDGGIHITGYYIEDETPPKEDNLSHMPKGNNVTGNYVFGTSALQEPLLIDIISSTNISFGFSDNNKFLNPYKENSIRTRTDDGTTVNTYYTLSQWTVASGYDANSVDWITFNSSATCNIGTNLTLNHTIIINPTTAASNVTIPSGTWMDLDYNLFSGSANLQSFDSKILLKCI